MRMTDHLSRITATINSLQGITTKTNGALTKKAYGGLHSTNRSSVRSCMEKESK